MLKTAFFAGAAAASVAAASFVVVTAQAPPSTVAAFTAEQAAAGRVAYAQSCARCHMPDLSGNGDIPQLSGDVFLSTWRTRSTKDLVDYLSETMPPAGPKQGPETYLAIGAYILQSNGALTGAEPLSRSTAVPLGSLLPMRGSD